MCAGLAVRSLCLDGVGGGGGGGWGGVCLQVWQ